ncbi:holin-like protein [Propionibacterium cyclohexanicum]|uniref:Holin-like protein n=1 Tax=Propionibacterium cyclohexanicum TaxID=64702 RepID=A0A1H9SA10_9ACTN|nr:CidA/LrgA family protein [Propionibacterium cyclohexanicum]SER81748.1 holin-like protein [Propionibacterium cyclohexanicum]
MNPHVNPKFTPHSLLRKSALVQFVLLSLLWALGCRIASSTGAPVPGAVIGLALALLLLATRVLVLPDIERASGWLISEMLLFFVPTVVALIVHPELLGWLGLKVLVVILASTISVMVVTSAAIELMSRLLSHPGTRAASHPLAHARIAFAGLVHSRARGLRHL